MIEGISCFAQRTGLQPVLVIFGPTACGKTDLVLRLFGAGADSPFAGQAEVISADSMQVYRGMNIGTAKPEIQVLQQLPHHLLDIHNPDEPFSAGDFVRQADSLCRDIIARNKLPVVAGGTGFYIKNFLCGLPATPEADETLRNFLKERLRREGAGVLYRELVQRDPASAAVIHPHDTYRIIRALEVCMSTGTPRSSFEVTNVLRSGFYFCIIILERPRAELYERINLRVQEMFDAGLVQEVESLTNAGYSASDPGMQAIGYREFFSLEIQKECSENRLNFIRDLIARDSRRYAKRQYTFFKGIPEACIFPVESIEEIQQHITAFCSTLS